MSHLTNLWIWSDMVVMWNWACHWQPRDVTWWASPAMVVIYAGEWKSESSSLHLMLGFAVVTIVPLDFALDGPPWGAVMRSGLRGAWGSAALDVITGCPDLADGPPLEGCLCGKVWLSLLGDLGTADESQRHAPKRCSRLYPPIAQTGSSRKAEYSVCIIQKLSLQYETSQVCLY